MSAEEFDKDRAPMEQAIKLGSSDRMRLRAEILLERANAGELPITKTERDELDRIAVVPSENDLGFLATFDWLLGQE